MNINPFTELYLGESIQGEKFVKLYSSLLLDSYPVFQKLFQPGHIILTGLPGSGKTMLLALLKSDIRLAYQKLGIQFPVPFELCDFIGAGINLNTSGIQNFGQRLNQDTDLNIFPLYFADYFNYWVVLDILISIKSIEKLNSNVGIAPSNLNNDFAVRFSNSDAWCGGLKSDSFESLISKIRKRIQDYKSYLNFNVRDIPDYISSTKSTIGEPIDCLVEVLREMSIVRPETNFFIRIDQFEELAWLDSVTPSIGNNFRSIIYKLLSLRSSNAFYRIGARPFAWAKDTHQIFGTTAQLEEDRNYIEVALESTLRRPESGHYLFKHFANDIVRRRLRFNAYEVDDFRGLVGDSMHKNEKAKVYVRTNFSNAVSIDVVWPQNWKDFLLGLASTDPFAARLAEAWALQKDENKSGIMVNPPSLGTQMPWDSKPYWVKERSHVALISIASRNRQQLIWSGTDDIFDLANSSILIFLKLCRKIWDVYGREEPSFEIIKTRPINYNIQTQAVLDTSYEYYTSIENGVKGKERKALVDVLGNYFQRELSSDRSFSYPGGNGFSILQDDLYSETELRNLLELSHDYGDIIILPHTTKNKDKRKRVKIYLNPVLAPYFRLPAIRTKEPLYWTLDILRKTLYPVIGKRYNMSGRVKPDYKQERLNTDISGEVQTSFDF